MADKDKRKRATLKMAKSKGGIIRAQDLKKGNLPRYTLTELVQQGKLKHVTKGVYCTHDHEFGVHHDIAVAATLMPKGIICLLSALHIHGLGTQYPDGVWIGIQNNLRTPKIDYPILHRVYYAPSDMRHGIETHEIEGVFVNVTSPARTVAECFKYRSKLGSEVILEALNQYWHYRKERGYNLRQLRNAAKKARVEAVMRPYIEAITS